MLGNQDTIVAIASAPGRGGVGVVRLSGPRAHALAAKVFRAKRARAQEAREPQKLIFGQIFDHENHVVDQGYLVHFVAPHSYTGEDAVEFFGHGAPVVLAEVVACFQAQGARLSRAGEFTQRAFLHGKMDLVQAEAVAELIEANSAVEAEAARRRLEGRLSQRLEELRTLLIGLLAELEAEIDFGEEDLDLISARGKEEKTKEIQLLMTSLRESYRAQEKLRDGFQVVLLGRPNVGKSSLFNALLQRDRAIVTSTPGTTRDVLREEITLEGRTLRLLDTAGLRTHSEDPIEGEGMRRSRKLSTEADLVLWILDAVEGESEADRAFLQELGPQAKCLKVWNKADLTQVEEAGTLTVSAKTGQGVEELRRQLGSLAAEAAPLESFGGISNDRHRECLDRAQVCMSRAEERVREGASSEFVAFELQEALRMVSEMVGATECAEAVLDHVFSRFCIGK